MVGTAWRGVRVLVVLLAGTLLGACGGGGDSSSATGTVSVAITDAPGSVYNAVVLTIEEVGIVASGTPTTYYNSSAINELPVTLDVLDFPREEIFHLADIEVPLDKPVCFHQIRLVLSEAEEKNYVEVDGKQQPLETPSGEESGAKILTPNQFCMDEDDTMVQIVLDFDPETAIVSNEKEPGKWSLKPTGIRIIEGIWWDDEPGASIFGRVFVPATYNSTFNSCTLPTMPLVTVEAHDEEVTTPCDPPVTDYRTVTLTEPPDGPVLNEEDCFYSGNFKLLLPEDDEYYVTANWDDLAVMEGPVNSATLTPPLNLVLDACE